MNTLQRHIVDSHGNTLMLRIDESVVEAIINDLFFCEDEPASFDEGDNSIL